MENKDILDNEDLRQLFPKRNNALLQLLGVLLRLAGFVISGSVIALLIAGLIFNIDYEAISKNGELPDDKFFILFLQGLTQLLSFIILPFLYIYYFKKSLAIKISHFKWNKFGLYAFFALLIMLFSIPIINFLVDWNKSIQLPDFLHNLETWMETKEAEAKRLTDIIAYYNNTTEFIIGLFVIAILPAIGEEFLFRGIIQNEINEILRNPHLAIWISGFIFSFLHFQFYGFFPRMLLGVTFGYLYYWSGTLLIPIIIHFLNNALTFILLNLYRDKVISLNPESSDSLPAFSIIISFIAFIFLLLTFKKLGKTEN